MTLSRKEVAYELSMSPTGLDNLLRDKKLPIRHKRLGDSQKAKYMFSLADTAKYIDYMDSAA
jgi:hypothetical protein